RCEPQAGAWDAGQPGRLADPRRLATDRGPHAQRISRAKQTVKASAVPFGMPTGNDWGGRLRSVLHVLYLIFNEGYLSTNGPELARADLSAEAIRLTRIVRLALPDDPEVAGLLALMLLTDARRPARTDTDGAIVPLADQDRTLWDRDLICEGTALIDEALAKGAAGEYQLQAAIAAGLALLAALDEPLAGHHRLHAVRGHLLEMAGDRDGAIDEYRTAASRATSVP